MSPLLILLCVGIGWTAMCLLIAEYVYANDRRVDRRIREFSQRGVKPAESSSPLFRDWNLADESVGTIVSSIRAFVRQSGLPVSARHLWLATGWLGLAGALLAVVVHPGFWATAAIAPLIPWAVLVWVRHCRIQQFRRQLPEAFDVMRRAVEAGQTVASAFQQVSTQCRPPLSMEFAHCGEQQNLGLSHDASLRDLSTRIPIIELKIFVISLIMQRQCGGSPVEVLQNMSELIRKRQRLAQRVKALTAEGRLQAIVLTALPLVTFIGMVMLWPDYVAPLLARPRLLMALAALQIVGTIWVRRTVQLDY